MPDLGAPSVSQINKAGRILKRWGKEGYPADKDTYAVSDEVMHALEILLRFRAAHSVPLVTANNGLRSMVKTAGCQVEVSQRLKRAPTILGKLLREPTLALSRMQDIGGCRAVVGSIPEIRAVQRRLVKNRPVYSISDYIETPRSSGYRGVHVVVDYGGRRIEMQLRTRVMHEWAVTVERLSGRLSEFFKSDGDHPIQQLMSVISQAMALEEEGKAVGVDVLDEMRRLRREAQPYLDRGTS